MYENVTGNFTSSENIRLSFTEKHDRKINICEISSYDLPDTEEDEEENVNVYGNVISDDDICQFKIRIEDLANVIIEKRHNKGFEKEYMSYHKEKAYIATQGPKRSTVRDFWHMVWQENVFKIVMVTQLQENRKAKEQRKVHHYHFTQWPDHGVPDSIKLVNFYRAVKNNTSDQHGPLLVHCSAGIGRTGTFIAIDSLYEHGKSVGYVNIFEYVKIMRRDRLNMIQTFVNDNYRPCLMSVGKHKNDYINAVIIPGYSSHGRFLVTQCPLKETVVDFWTMVYDHDSSIVVLLDSPNEDAPLWFGKNKTLEFENYNIDLDIDNTSEGVQLSLVHRGNQPDKRSIFVFSAKKFEIGSTSLPSTTNMNVLLQRVNEQRKQRTGPVTVVCRNGATKCGLFVALSLLLEKMKIDDQVDVFQVIRTIQTRLPEFLSNFDQYEYCYKCIKDFLERDSVYANL
ncbi:receptor-type tyrosine-protein phosphatase gamma-like [Mytilus californianus]|uniref:receptor-type tyrosine-protein phosphatase gamma-like n=1 Tax=Mytilus californianus TaxID=6549 RepID=UPI002244FE51|nr:receptor-type tyrosine-protein phosphatase gamma-like [Mytilus californianus]